MRVLYPVAASPPGRLSPADWVSAVQSALAWGAGVAVVLAPLLTTIGPLITQAGTQLGWSWLAVAGGVFVSVGNFLYTLARLKATGPPR